MTLDRDTIRREVARLAPWYYQFDLCGVRTDATAPGDHSGHRKVAMPRVRDGFWQGRSVLDMGCAEGAWGFGALGHGAATVRAVDCRESHVEKGRFVARVLGHDRITFEVGTADGWSLEHPDARFDVVIFCGLIYHLQRPWQTVARYCRLAREAILLTSVLAGGADGWTRWQERDSLAASDGAKDSMTPNTVDTLIAEFGKHQFVPSHLYETGHPDHAGGCALLLERSQAVKPLGSTGGDPRALAIHVGMPRGELTLALYNRRPQAWMGIGTLAIRDEAGRESWARGPEPLAFPARRTESDADACTSIDFRFAQVVTGSGRRVVVARVQDAAGNLVCEASFLVQR